MSNQELAEELREYTAMKYAGDCKCGKCQLVPRALVERIYHTLNAFPAQGSAGSREIEIVRLIDILRSQEGDSVTILCDNPDFNGQPNCAVVCNGGWTDYQDRRFAADTVLDALAMAMTEHALPTPRKVIAESNGHHWIERFNLVCCRDCGFVRRADDKNKPCKGAVGIGLRAHHAERAPPAERPDLIKALADARDQFEVIRLILINHLAEPERQAFWKAVAARDAAASALAGQSPAESNLQAAIEGIPTGLNWLIGRGKTRPNEPPFGVQLLDGLKIVAETEGDDLYSTIREAVSSVGRSEMRKIPENVEVAIKRMRCLADSALGSLYEVECQRAMRNACVLLENAYRPSQPECVTEAALTAWFRHNASDDQPAALIAQAFAHDFDVRRK